MSKNSLIQSLKDVANRQDIDLNFIISQIEKEFSSLNHNSKSIDVNLIFDGRKTRYSNERLDDIKLGIVLKEILQYLKQSSSSSLDSINFRNNEITSKGIQSTLVDFLEQSAFINVHIKHIDLQNNVIDGSNLYLLLNGCAQLDSLASLNLSFNTNLGREGALYIADYIQSLRPNHSLKALYLNNCGFDLTSILAIITSLSTSPSHCNNSFSPSLLLQVLELDRPVIDKCPQQEIMDHLSRVVQLPSSSQLQSISLQHACISDWGIQRLTECLLLNSSAVYGSRSTASSYRLKSLNLQGNQINIHGATALARLLLKSTATNSSSTNSAAADGGDVVAGGGLEVLKLSYNLIGEEGCIALAKSLEVNKSLKVLNLRKCHLSSSLTQLAQSLLMNTTLQELSVFKNKFDQNTCQAFQQLFDHHQHQKQSMIDGTADSNSLVFKTDFELYCVDSVYHVAEIQLLEE